MEDASCEGWAGAHSALDAAVPPFSWWLCKKMHWEGLSCCHKDTQHEARSITRKAPNLISQVLANCGAVVLWRQLLASVFPREPARDLWQEKGIFLRLQSWTSFTSQLCRCGYCFWSRFLARQESLNDSKPLALDSYTFFHSICRGLIGN